MIDNYILLKAINHEQNVYRQYTIESGQNLFGEWFVRTQFGRIGTDGRTKSYVLNNNAECLNKISSLLRRRLHSKGRIGCDYKLIEQVTA